jgi:hypothetical protein
MNQEKEEVVIVEEEVRLIKYILNFKINKIIKLFYFIYLSFSRVKMAVVRVKQQQIVVLINSKHKQMMMMMKKKMNLFMLNQVHALGGKNDVKQYNNEFIFHF